jgi:phosphatidylserine/phosphatidylglycerophosphate/cardiolipin synthase-like enzyme
MSTGNNITALIDGEEIFRSMAADMNSVDGQGFIYMAFWMMDPYMTLDIRNRLTLEALLRQKVEQGVPIYLLVWDYCSNIVQSIQGRLGIPDRQALGHVLQLLLIVLPFYEPHIRQLIDDLYHRNPHVTVRNLTTLVDNLHQRHLHNIHLILAQFPDYTMPSGQATFSGLNLGSHHQKILVVNRPGENGDRRLIAHIVGTNLHNDYLDNPEHRINYPTTGSSLRNRPWHDTGVRLEGPEAAQVEGEFIRRWELNRLMTAYSSMPRLTPSGISNHFSQGISSCFAITSSQQTQIKTDLIHYLRRARHSIYVEDQYFSNTELIDEIINAYLAAEREGRRLDVCLLTNSPTEFRGPQSIMEIYRYVNFLKLRVATCESLRLNDNRIIQRQGSNWRLCPTSRLPNIINPIFRDILRRILPCSELKWDIPNLQVIIGHGQRIPITAIREIRGGIRPAYIVSSDRTNNIRSRRRSIYVHSKTTIIDDEIVFIGSANYSVRSMEYDSESCLEIFDSEFATRLRKKLFAEMTGCSLSELDRHNRSAQFQRWNLYAKDNATHRNPVHGTNVYLIQYPDTQLNFVRIGQLVWRIIVEIARLRVRIPIIIHIIGYQAEIGFQLLLLWLHRFH